MKRETARRWWEGEAETKERGKKRSREGIVDLGPDINKVKGRRKEEDGLKREVDRRRAGQLFFQIK